MQAGIKAGILSGSITAASVVGASEAWNCMNALIADICPAVVSKDDPVRVCQWEYGYRAPEAAAFFKEITSRVQACPEDFSEQPPDMAVNHPDSYQLRRFMSGTMMISVSLKDKAALERSFVFLRIDGASEQAQ